MAIGLEELESAYHSEAPVRMLPLLEKQDQTQLQTRGILYKLENLAQNDSVEISAGADEPIADTGYPYLNYVFSDRTEDLSLATGDIPFIIDAMFDVSEGLDELMPHADRLSNELKMMLRGRSYQEIANSFDMTTVQAKKRLQNFRIRMVRRAKRRGLDQDGMYEILKTHIEKGRTVEPVVQPEDVSSQEREVLQEPLTGRMKKLVDQWAGMNISEHFQRSDAIAITEAYSAINEPWDPRAKPDMRKSVLYHALIGFGIGEIMEIKGMSRDSVERYLYLTKRDTQAKIEKNGIDAASLMNTYVQLFRNDSSYEVELQKTSAEVYKLSRLPDLPRKNELAIARHRLPRKPRATTIASDKLRESVAKEKKSHTIVQPEKNGAPIEQVDSSLFDQYRSAQRIDKYPVDTECPEFTTVWGQMTMTNLYNMIHDSNTLEHPATIIMKRADGRDKTRHPDRDTVMALNRIRRIAGRTKTDFGDDERKKKAFDMLTIPTEENGLNTLGDIYRSLRQDYPDLDERTVAEIVSGSIGDVLRDQEGLLVVNHS